MVKAKEDWGKCSDDYKQQLIHSLEKNINVLVKATSKSNASNQQVHNKFLIGLVFVISVVSYILIHHLFT